MSDSEDFSGNSMNSMLNLDAVTMQIDSVRATMYLYMIYGLERHLTLNFRRGGGCGPAVPVQDKLQHI